MPSVRRPAAISSAAVRYSAQLTVRSRRLPSLVYGWWRAGAFPYNSAASSRTRKTVRPGIAKMLARGDEGAGAGDGELMVRENSLRSHGAANFPTPPGYGASLRATGVTGRGRRAGGRRSGSARSSWFRWTHSECAGLWRRSPDRAVRSGRARPCLRRSEEHTSELQSRLHLVCRLLLEKKKKKLSKKINEKRKKKKQKNSKY